MGIEEQARRQRDSDQSSRTSEKNDKAKQAFRKRGNAFLKHLLGKVEPKYRQYFTAYHPEHGQSMYLVWGASVKDWPTTVTQYTPEYERLMKKRTIAPWVEKHQVVVSNDNTVNVFRKWTTGHNAPKDHHDTIVTNGSFDEAADAVIELAAVQVDDAYKADAAKNNSSIRFAFGGLTTLAIIVFGIGYLFH